MLPFVLPLSKAHLDGVTTVGVGMLIGTAFAVIIPEGIHTIYGTHDHDHDHKEYEVYDAYDHAAQAPAHNHDHDHDHDHLRRRRLAGAEEDAFKQPSRVYEDSDPRESAQESGSPTLVGPVHTQDAGSSSSEHGTCTIELEPAWAGNYIGLALVGGFVFQLIADRLQGSEGHGHSHGSTSGNSSHNHGDEEEGLLGGHNHDDKKEKVAASTNSWRATFGVLVHSAVDGVAMGAISVAENEALEFVVFMAIILHKAPAAFGLSAFLMQSKVTKAEIRQQVFVFALMAPLSAIATYVLLSLGGDAYTLASDSKNYLGLCLLFSGGTFVYTVSVHILPGLQNDGTKSTTGLVQMVVGLLLPVVLSLNHNHGH
jgi:zinc transporter 9